MNTERRATALIDRDGQVRSGIFHLSDEVAETPESVELVLELGPDRRMVGIAATFFDAMVAIRKQLEPEGLKLACYGASRNVYPSPMSRGMGTGDRAYRLTAGKPAAMRDLVDIFDSDADVIPATVEEQEGAYREWLGSLRPKGANRT